MRVSAAFAVVAAITALSQPARAAVTCPGLAAALDDSVAWASQALADNTFFPMWDESLPIWVAYPSRAAFGRGADCWKQRAGAPVDKKTQASVIRASSLALSISRWHDGRVNWDYLSSAYEIERMTGVEGPVSQYLADPSSYFEMDETSVWPKLWSRNTSLGITEFSAMCSAFGGSAEALAVGGYSIDPSVKTAGARGGDLYDAFLEAERVRAVEECPLP